MTATKEQQLLDLLVEVGVESHGWILVDDWDADRCAVGIADAAEPRRLVSVSVFQQAPGSCYVECETPALGSETGDTTRSGSCEEVQALLEVLTEHLGGGTAERRL